MSHCIAHNSAWEVTCYKKTEPSWVTKTSNKKMSESHCCKSGYSRTAKVSDIYIHLARGEAVIHTYKALSICWLNNTQKAASSFWLHIMLRWGKITDPLLSYWEWWKARQRPGKVHICDWSNSKNQKFSSICISRVCDDGRACKWHRFEIGRIFHV